MKGEKKVSVILTDRNAEALAKLADSLGEKISPTVNLLISAFAGDITDTIRNDIYGLCQVKVTELYKQFYNASKFQEKELTQDLNRYTNIAKLIRGNASITSEDLDIGFQQIRIKNGIAKIPKDDWILVNPEDAEKCEHVCIVEFRNSRLYNAPHFCFFTNVEMGKDYNEEEINRRCAEKWPDFNKLLGMHVELKRDPKNPAVYLNLDEWNRSPQIGYFPLVEFRNSVYKKAGRKAPCGAYIIRDQD